MQPIQRTVEWLCNAISAMPLDIKMVYIESSEYVTPSPESQTVACFDLFGFKAVPLNGFNPQNEHHVGSLGGWDFEGRPNCEFRHTPFDEYEWLNVLESAVRDPSVLAVIDERKLFLLFAEHDGPITVFNR